MEAGDGRGLAQRSGGLADAISGGIAAQDLDAGEGPCVKPRLSGSRTPAYETPRHAKPRHLFKLRLICLIRAVKGK